MITVLQTISGIYEHTGGPAESVPRLCSALKDSGHAVILATLAGKLSSSALECQDNGVDLRVYPHIKHCSLPICSGILQLSREVDLIHGHGLWEPTNWVTGLVARYVKRPLVISPRGSLEPLRLEHSAWKKKAAGIFFDNSCLRYASCIHACSDMEYESIRSYGLKNPVAVIPNGVSYTFTPVEKDIYRNRFFCRYPEVNGKKVLLFLSRLSWEKGLPLLAEAWARTAPQFVDWHLVIAGSGTVHYENEMKSHFEERNLSKCVTWTGLLRGSDKLDAFAAADLFILPTHSENFGIAIAEALALGVPTITTHGAPWNELLSHKCGWWVPIDVENITTALHQALSMPDEELKSMGARGKDLISNKYTWPAIASQMGDVYRWLLGQGDKPFCVNLN